MKRRTTLSRLSYKDLSDSPAWAAVGDYAEAEDAELEPVRLDAQGRIPSDGEEIWCLCSAMFADASEHLATAMCRGDSSDGPLLWGVWNGAENVPLLLPPSPDFVLSKCGPRVFTEKFNSNLAAVFPLVIKVAVPFVMSPEERYAKLGVTGIL